MRVQEDKGTIVQSVERALNILECFSKTDKEIGVTELAQRLGLKKSTCYGLINTLYHRGYLDFNESTSKYKLGLKIFEIGQIFETSLELRELAKPYLKKLAEEVKETVHLVMRDDMDAVYVEKVEGPTSFNIISHVGKRAERHCTAVGKMVLAHLTEQELNDIKDSNFVKYTNNTITDFNKLKEDIEQIKIKGYSTDNQEVEIGLRCIAVPVYNHRKELVGAVSISGPITRITEDKIDEYVNKIKETAKVITNAIGG